MSAARAAADADERLALLQRGRKGRAVKREDAHLETVEPVALADVPAPYDARGEAGLDDAERTDLDRCEQAVAGLQRALATAGKALATINRARLYRGTHSTFEAYVEDRWGMRRAHAYRLIEAWPVAAALSPIGDTNEAQVRELLPAAKRHGLEAATAVYAELREQGGRITAARLRDAVRVLPPRLATPDQARDVVRVAVAEGRLTTAAPRTPDRSPNEDQDDVVDAEIVGEGARAVTVLAQVADKQRRLYDDLGDGMISVALTADPGRAEALLREITQYANRTAYRARQTRPEAD